jgi:excisionase family DNA binding protein
MPRGSDAESALFVRLPTEAAAKLDRASQALGVRKKDLVASLVSKYVPHLGPTQGTYSFQSYDPPEVMNADQAGEFLQVDPELVVEMAEAGNLPGRKLGSDWRFSRAALVQWLSTPEKPERGGRR